MRIEFSTNIWEITTCKNSLLFVRFFAVVWCKHFFIRHITHPYQIAIVFDSGFYLASYARRGIALRHRGTVGASGGTVGFHILWILGHCAAVRFRQHTPRKRRKQGTSHNTRHRHFLSGVSALLQLTFKIAQLLLALRTSAFAVALMLTLAGHKLNIVGFRNLLSNLLQDFAFLFSRQHNQFYSFYRLHINYYNHTLRRIIDAQKSHDTVTHNNSIISHRKDNPPLPISPNFPSKKTCLPKILGGTYF